MRAQGQRVGAPAQPGGGESAHGAQEPAESETAQEKTKNSGRRTPKPKAANGYSGRILVRMPSELHEQLAHAAEREDVSLNRYVTQTLSTSVDNDHGSVSPGARGLRLAVATNIAIMIVAAVVAVVLLVLALQRGI